jgi:signal transduction histidine kinase
MPHGRPPRVEGYLAAIDPTVGRVELDPGRLKQVFYNYLSNAIKFTPLEGRVIVRVRPEGSTRFRIEIEDNGIGVADTPRLFVEFQQLATSTTKRFARTGLGLALTRRIVEAQGGSVGVTSNLEFGIWNSAIYRDRAEMRRAGR